MTKEQIQKQLGSLASLFLVVATILLIALTFSTINKMKNPAPMQNYITVNGMGKTTVSPDLAVITFSVRSDADTTEAAQSANTTTTNTLITALRGMGIEDKDLKTQNYSLYENRIWNPTTGRDESDGWVVQQDLQIKVRDNTKVGDVLAMAGKYGVTNVQGPNFQKDDDSAYKAEARDLAIADAKEQAEKIAAQLGVDLGEVTGYSEWETSPTPYYDYAVSSMMGEKGGAGAPELATGESEVSMNVSLTFTLN